MVSDPASARISSRALAAEVPDEVDAPSAAVVAIWPEFPTVCNVTAFPSHCRAGFPAAAEGNQSSGW